MRERMEQLIGAGGSPPFEPPARGRGHAALIRRCQSLGYRFTLLFFWLRSPELAMARVAQRVSEGHDIPPTLSAAAMAPDGAIC